MESSNKKVIVKLMGGLGNQMLQYATGMSFAKEINAQLLINVDYFKIDTELDDTHREFELSIFNISNDRYTGLLSNNLGRKFFLHSTLLRKVILPLAGINYYIDKDFPDFSSNKKINYLDGFWSKTKYFNKYKPDLRALYSFSDKMQGKNEQLSKLMMQQNSVAVHIRRTDYLLPHSNHPVLNVSYYKQAMDLIRSNSSNLIFYFFGDDHKWIRENFEINGVNIILVDHNSGRFSYLDMGLMTYCRHVIISNSTFSWWGAYLNNNKGIITAPEKWITNSEHPYFIYDEFIPAEWKRISI